MPRRAVEVCWPTVTVAIALAVVLGAVQARADEPAPPAAADAPAAPGTPAAPRRPRPRRRCTSGSTRSSKRRRRAPWRRRLRMPISCGARISISLARFPTRRPRGLFSTIPRRRSARRWSIALLARPQFARQMARVFDVLLMERRADKGVTGSEWQEYLRQRFAEGKPLDQLCREILAADGVDPALRPAAKFYLDRDGDANLLARDIGRLFFGRDLQCAQCHDHPLVADYLQSEYYGLLAFVGRGVLFTDDKAKTTYYAENADGEVNYKSVFTGDTRDHVVPKVPLGAPISEPLLTKEEQYVVAPAKGVRGVPKYSRRAQLASVATGGTSTAFNRNWANRLWAQMMGRGLVHPLDMQHSGNPSVQSRLLALLADELVRMKFDTRAFLRELALTRAYARTSETAPAGELKFDAAAAGTALAAAEAEGEKLKAEIPGLEAATSAASTAAGAAYEKFSQAATAHDAAQKARGEAKKASDDVSVALAAAIKDVAAKEDVHKALVEARDKAQAAVAKLPDDKPLAEAAAQFKARAETFEGQLAAARKLVVDKTAEVQAASLKLAEADKNGAGAAAALTLARGELEKADAAGREALDKHRDGHGPSGRAGGAGGRLESRDRCASPGGGGGRLAGLGPSRRRGAGLGQERRHGDRRANGRAGSRGQDGQRQGGGRSRGARRGGRGTG